MILVVLNFDVKVWADTAKLVDVIIARFRYA